MTRSAEAQRFRWEFRLARASRTSADCRFTRHISAGSIAASGRGSFSSTATARTWRHGRRTGRPRRWNRDPGTAHRRLRRHPAAQGPGRGSGGTECGTSRLGLAALRAGSRLTQIAIDRRLTLIAFEAMNHWQSDGGFGLHVFHKNNELAGYCSVLHAMQLAGHHRQLWPPAARCRHRVRRDRPRRGHRPERPRR